MFPTAFRRLLLPGLEAHDLALSKLERNSARDREDIKYLARVAPLDPPVLESRYPAELRRYPCEHGEARFDDAPLAGNAVRRLIRGKPRCR